MLGRRDRAVGDPAAVADRRGRRSRRCCPAGGGRCGCCGSFVLYVTPRACCWSCCSGCWLASGFGRRIRTPYFEGIHYDLVQGMMWVVFREARRVLRARDRDRGPGAGRAPRDAADGRLPARRPGRLVHADPRADGLVRPRAAGRAQGHDGLGPGRSTSLLQPDPGPLHLDQPRPRGRTSSRRSRELARGLDENDAFVIFPEGGNFTAERRRPRRSSGCAAGSRPDGATAPSG